MVLEEEIITALATNEKIVSALYKIFSGKFPDHKELWSNLANEEIEHANLIYTLESKVKQGQLHFNEKRFRKEAIQTFQKYAENKLTDMQKQEASLIKALGIALDIEGSLIENKFFEVFEGDSPDLKKVLSDLARSTAQHKERIQKALDMARQSRP